MQRNIFSAFCFAIIVLGLASCSGDKFSQIVEVDLPEHEPMLSVSAAFSQVDTLLNVFVSQTWPTTERPDTIEVNNATVRLFKDGNLLREFTPTQSGSYETVGEGILSDIGGTYRLEISAPGFEPVFAEQRMLAAVEIKEVMYDSAGIAGPDGDKANEIVVEFDDPAGEGDYYALSVHRATCYQDPGMGTFCSSDKVPLETYDPLLEYGAGDVLITSDKALDGEKITLRVFTYNSLEPSAENEFVVVQLVHITREKFLFLRSLEQFYNADGNPFAEPVTVQSNIEGGVGLFSLEAVDTMHIQF